MLAALGPPNESSDDAPNAWPIGADTVRRRKRYIAQGTDALPISCRALAAGNHARDGAKTITQAE